jgi:purine-binding chemotaxis protein CheW
MSEQELSPATAGESGAGALAPVASADSGGEATSDANQYLTFRVEGQTYGVSILRVKEIIEHGSLTRVPLTPDYIRGVVNLRGNVVPIVDLAVRLGRPPEPVGKRTCHIIVEMDDAAGGSVDLGFMVSAIDEVVGLPAEDIEASPSFGADVPADFIAGMGRRENGFITLLDLDVVLSIDELSRFRAAFGGS